MLGRKLGPGLEGASSLAFSVLTVSELNRLRLGRGRIWKRQSEYSLPATKPKERSKSYWNEVFQKSPSFSSPGQKAKPKPSPRSSAHLSEAFWEELPALPPA